MENLVEMKTSPGLWGPKHRLQKENVKKKKTFSDEPVMEILLKMACKSSDGKYRFMWASSFLRCSVSCLFKYLTYVYLSGPFLFLSFSGMKVNFEVVNLMDMEFLKGVMAWNLKDNLEMERLKV